MKFCFGDIVVIEDDLIGVIVKSFGRSLKGAEPNYDVYVRMYNGIKNYTESDIQRYMVRHKCLDDQELEWQNNAIRGI